MRLLRWIILIGWTFILCANCLVYAQSSIKVLTLKEAIKNALLNNPSILSKRALIKAAEKEKRAQWGKHLPHVNIIGQASKTRYPTAITPISGIGHFPHFSKDSYLYNIDLEFPIYEGGKISKRVKIAEIDISIKDSLEKQTAHDLIANIKDTFYLALYLKSLIKAQQDAINALKKEYKDASLRLKVQKIAPLDLLRIKSQLKAEEAALSNSKEYLKRTKQAIYVLMGNSPSDNFLICGKFPKDIFIPKADSDIKKFLDYRPDIEAAKRDVDKALEKVSLAWRENLPSIDLFSSYGRKAGAGLHHDEDLWEIGLRLNLNIYSGGTISAEVDKAKAELRAAKENLRQQELTAKQQIKAAISKLISTKDEVEHYKIARDTAKEAFRVESLKYRTGAGTVTDMLISQSTWLKAEADYLFAVYRHQKAKIEYEYSTGTIGIGWLNRSN